MGTVTVMNLTLNLYFLMFVAFGLHSFPTQHVSPDNAKGPYVLTFEGPRWMDFLTLEPGLGEGALRDRVRALLNELRK